MINVTVWNEYYSEREYPASSAVYPEGLHSVIKDGLSRDTEFFVRTATLDEPCQGLPDDILENTDVLIWWGHVKHGDVDDALAERIHKRVLNGMGFISLHSGHLSKPFTKLMGTSCSLRWHEMDERERLWVVNPGHPIAKDLPPYFEVEKDEMYGEFFDIPTPDELVFISWFQTGEVFRSGCCYTRGYGRIFYFQPGHETNPVYKNQYIQKVISNAVHWAKPTNINTVNPEQICVRISDPLEKI